MRLLAVVIPVVLTACVRTINPEPVPVPGVVMQTWSVEVREPRARDIFMRNDSERDLTVTSVQLYNCRNLKQECKAYQTNVTIPPGKTVKAMRLEPENLKLSWQYQYNYNLRQAASRTGPPTVVTHITGIPAPGMGVRLSDPREFRAAVTAITDNPTCHARNPVPGPPGMSGVAIVFGVTEANIRTVTVYTRTDGTPNQYSDFRIRADGQRTSINVLFEPQLAIMRNSGGSGPDQDFNVSGPDVLRAPSLGNPEAIVAYVMKECGKK